MTLASACWAGSDEFFRTLSVWLETWDWIDLRTSRYLSAGMLWVTNISVDRFNSVSLLCDSVRSWAMASAFSARLVYHSRTRTNASSTAMTASEIFDPDSFQK